LSTPNHSVEEKFIDNSFCLFVVAKINTPEQMCGIVHQFEILNCFQFHRLAHITEEFPEENEWEKQDFQNDFQNTSDEQIGELNEVHPQFLMDERQTDVSGKST
jgi:hypothetical protein